MNAPVNSLSIKSLIEQTTNNTSSWIGHCTIDNQDIIGGQTFIAPQEVDLEAISVFSSIVSIPGKVFMTVHHIDTLLKDWGPVLGSANLDFTNTDNGQWKSFPIASLHLNKGKTYGFRLESPHSYIGMGEAAGSYQAPPFFNGQEWQFTGDDKNGKPFTYFSLAFKVAVRA